MVRQLWKWHWFGRILKHAWNNIGLLLFVLSGESVRAYYSISSYKYQQQHQHLGVPFALAVIMFLNVLQYFQGRRPFWCASCSRWYTLLPCASLYIIECLFNVVFTSCITAFTVLTSPCWRVIWQIQLNLKYVFLKPSACTVYHVKHQGQQHVSW